MKTSQYTRDTAFRSLEPLRKLRDKDTTQPAVKVAINAYVEQLSGLINEK